MGYEQAHSKPFNDMLRRVPCIDRIHQIIGWQPQTPLDAIIQSVAGFMAAHPS